MAKTLRVRERERERESARRRHTESRRRKEQCKKCVGRNVQRTQGEKRTDYERLKHENNSKTNEQLGE